MLDKGDMDSSVQKGGVPGVSGCLEPPSAVSDGDLAVLRLGLTTTPPKLLP